jgi:hypothetical protein
MAHSKAPTTSPTTNNAQPSQLKKVVIAFTHGRSNNSTPILFIIAKKSLRNPTIFPYSQSMIWSSTVSATKSNINI